MIGAMAVVAGDVRAYEIVVGNPARAVRTRFDPTVVLALERIAWWNWNEETISAELPYLLQADVQAFIERWEGTP